MNKVFKQLTHSLDAIHLEVCAVWRYFVLVRVIRILDRKVQICLFLWLILWRLLLVCRRARFVFRFLWVDFAIGLTLVSAWLARHVGLYFRPGEILKICHVLEPLQSAVREHLLQGHVHCRKLVAQLFAKQLMTHEVELSKCILDKSD